MSNSWFADAGRLFWMRLFTEVIFTKNMTVWPKTSSGKFSFAMAIFFGISLFLRILHLHMGGFRTSLDGLLEILFFFSEYAAGAAAVLSGLLSILVKRERSIIVILYTATPLIFALLMFLASLL